MVTALRAVFDDRYAAADPAATANSRPGSVLQASDPVPLEMFTIRGLAERRKRGQERGW